MKDNVPYGMKDYYNFFCKENPYITISKKQFHNIISEFNKLVAKSLIEDLSIKLPNRLGDIEIVKTKRKAYISKDGKLKNNIPIDWKATNLLWEKDPKMKKNKVLIRFSNVNTDGYVFRIYYNKRNAIYKNKTIYFFKPVRSLARSITERINDYSKIKFDTYIKKNYSND